MSNDNAKGPSKSDYLYETMGNDNVQESRSSYVLTDLNKNRKPVEEVKEATSEYVLRELQAQHDESRNYVFEAPERPFLVGLPISVRQLRAKVDSMENVVVIPHLINGQLFFTTNGDEDVRTAHDSNSTHELQGNVSGRVVMDGMKFSYAQIVELLGESTALRLEREFVRQQNANVQVMGRNGEIKTARVPSSAALKTARSKDSLWSADAITAYEIPSLRTAHSVSRHGKLVRAESADSLWSAAAHTAVSIPSLKTASSVSTRSMNYNTPAYNWYEGTDLVRTARARSNDSLWSVDARTALSIPRTSRSNVTLHTAQSVEPNLFSARTAVSSASGVQTARSSPSFAGLRTARSSTSTVGLHTAQSVEPNLLSARTAVSSASGVNRAISSTSGFDTARSISSASAVNTAQSVEPNLFSARTAVSSASGIQTARSSPSAAALQTAQSVEPNLFSARTAISSASGVQTARSSPSVAGLRTARSSTSTVGLHTAQSVEPNLLSARTAVSSASGVNRAISSTSGFDTARSISSATGVHTAQSVEPNLFSARTAVSSASGVQTAKSSPSDLYTAKSNFATSRTAVSSTSGVVTAKSSESGVNLHTARSRGSRFSSLVDVTAQSPEPNLKSVWTAKEHSEADVHTARHASEDVHTAHDLLSSRESTDVRTGIEISSD